MINFKKVTLLLGIGLVIVGVIVIWTEVSLSNPIPGDLQLKVPKDKILLSKEVDWIVWDEGGVGYENLGRIVQYDYISDGAVGQATYNGLVEDMSKRTGNAMFFLKDKKQDKEVWQAIFYTGTPFFYIPHEDKWYQVETATTTIDAFRSQTTLNWFEKWIGGKALASSTTTTSIYVSSSDDRIDNSGSDWATVQGATSGNGGPWGSSETNIALTGKEGSTYYIYRGFLPFDTSSLEDSASIATSSLYFYVSDKQDATSDGYISLVQATPANPTGLTQADFDQVGITLGATNKNITGEINNGAYNYYELNSTGIGWISKSGWTTFGLREKYDMGNATNTSAFNRVQIRYSEYGGTAYDPYLAITYTYTVPLLEVRKSKDQGVNSTTTLKIDEELILVLEANKTYMIDGVIFASSTSNIPDIKIAFDAPDAGSWVTKIGFIAASSAFRYAEMLEGDKKESSGIDITANTATVIQISGTVKTDSTVGDLALWWVQANSNLAETVVREGSYLRAVEVQ